MFEGTPLNLKIRTKDQGSPLLLTFAYPESYTQQGIRSIIMFVSHTCMEPNEFSNTGMYILNLAQNGQRVKIPGPINPKTGKTMNFDSQWLYMALTYDQKEPCIIKINSRFTNPQVRKVEKLPTAQTLQD